MENRPDIGKMLEEELAKAKAEGKLGASSEKPITSEEIERMAAEQRPDKDVDDAIEALKGETDEAKAKVDSLAVSEATRAMHALRKGDRATLATIKSDFLAKAREEAPDMDEASALAMLSDTFRQYHDAYKELNKDEFAAEIDSFRRSLETSTEVTTDAGRAYLRRLNAGEFPTLESAINAFEGVKAQAKGQEEALNAEFNQLFAAAQDYFAGKQQSGKGEKPDLGDVSDQEIDNMFGGL